MAILTFKTAAEDFVWLPDLIDVDLGTVTDVVRSATLYSATWETDRGTVAVTFTGTGFQYTDGLFPSGQRPIDGIASGMTVTVNGEQWFVATSLAKPLADIDHFWQGFERNGDPRRGADTFNLFTFLGTGNDKIYGSADGDDLFAGRNPGNDSLYGGAGDDFIKADMGSDLISGGKGFDFYSLTETFFDAYATRGAIVNLATGTATDSWGGKDTLLSIEMVEGSRFGDVITGSSIGNIFRGMKGRDTIDGGGGNDLVQYDKDFGFGGTRGVSVNLATGTGRDGWGNLDTLKSIEHVDGSRMADTITGSTAANRLSGGDGQDTLSGGGGNDSLIGGSGLDRMTGGTGADSFIFGGWGGTEPFGDTITDFASGVDNLFFDTGSIAGMDDTLRFNTGAAATGSGSSFFFDPANSTLYWDSDGTGATAAVVAVVLTGVTSLAQTDIILA